jgi:hypothetical protein
MAGTPLTEAAPIRIPASAAKAPTVVNSPKARLIRPVMP